MSCKSKYTPAEFLAIMAIGFVQGNLPPSVNEKGEPVYVIQKTTQETIHSGCAATLVIQSTANKEFLDQLDKVKTHTQCNVKNLSSQTSIYMWELMLIEAGPLLMCYGEHVGFDGHCDYCGQTRAAIIEFFQDLQNCHDVAARAWWAATKHAGLNKESADKMFRGIMLGELKTVAEKHNIPWSTVEVEIIQLGESLRERIPAITQVAVAI